MEMKHILVTLAIAIAAAVIYDMFVKKALKISAYEEGYN